MIQDDHYSLLSIVFIVAKHNYSIELLLTSITSSPEVITRFSFAMVPMYFLTLSNKETPKEIIDFYVRCSYSCCGPLFQVNDYIGNVLNTNFTIKKKMLNESITSCMEVCENPDPKVISAYFKLTIFYLLFRDNGEENKCINILFNNSKFYAPSTPRSPSVSVISKQQVEPPVSFGRGWIEQSQKCAFQLFLPLSSHQCYSVRVYSIKRTK